MCGIQIGAAYDPKNNMVYVADYGCGQVDVINAKTQQFVTAITGVCGPAGVVYSTTGNDIFVAGFGCGFVTVINPTTNTITTTIGTCGTYPEWLDQLNGGNVYVASRYSCVDEINATTNTVVKTVTVGSCAYGGAVNQADKEVYVSDACNNNIYVLTKNLKPVTVLTGIPSVSGLFYNSKTQEVYAANYDNSTITPITKNNIVLPPIIVGNGKAMPQWGCSTKASIYVTGGTTYTWLKNNTVKAVVTIPGAYPFSCAGT